MTRSICGIVSHSGPNGEPLACGYPSEHDGDHAFATLPTWDKAEQESESRWAQRYLERAQAAEARAQELERQLDVEYRNALGAEREAEEAEARAQAAEAERDRLRHALERYHALMGNVHGVTQNPVGSAAWNAWMAERKKSQIEAQRALAAAPEPEKG